MVMMLIIMLALALVLAIVVSLLVHAQAGPGFSMPVFFAVWAYFSFAAGIITLLTASIIMLDRAI